LSKRSFDSIVTELRALRASGSPVFAVHYACEDLYKATDHSPAISGVVFTEIDSGEVTAYSVVDRAEQSERYVLESCFDFLQSNAHARFVHWNMNKPDFGFQALLNRFVRICGGEPPATPPSDRLIDLDDLISLGCGSDFAEHPKLKNLAILNGIPLRNFLGGKDEAERFTKGAHGDIRRSLVEKVSLIGKLARSVMDGTLETKHSGQRVDFAGASLDSVKVVTMIGDRFVDVKRQLLRRHDDRPTLSVADEYDAQDLVHSLLKVFFDDIRPEEWSPSYAGASARIDFVLPRYRLAIELKHTRPSMKTRELGEQLLVDVLKYKVHPNVRHLVCLVFDPGGHVANPRGVESDLSKPSEGLAVTVRIYDR
jgi:REase_DpnII-MboI